MAMTTSQSLTSALDQQIAQHILQASGWIGFDVFMRQALVYGARGLGTTATNPSVGAIVTRDTPDGPVVVARGHTQPGGRPHGEAHAFSRAGAASMGGTLYVTLEPCSHRSVRGGIPCVEHTILSGVRRVVWPFIHSIKTWAGKLRPVGCVRNRGVLAR